MIRYRYPSYFQVSPSSFKFIRLIRLPKYPWLTQRGEGATPKAIEERIAKLKREAKTLDGPVKPAKTPPAPSMGRKRRKSTKGMDMENEDDDDEEKYGEKKKVKEEC